MKTDLTTGDNALLVQPKFPWPSKSKNSHQSIPYGLLRIGNWMNYEGINVEFKRGCEEISDFNPNEIWITSLFSYWADHVKETFDYYSNLYPQARIIVGGILPSLSREYCIEEFGEENVNVGLFQKAEGFDADYNLLETDPELQVLISTRGCIRNCKFCYAWRIEGKIQPYPIEQVFSWIRKNRVIFYDNNILAHPQIEKLLDGLSKVKVNGRVVNYECQSGFDGRILQRKPELAKLLKTARFKHPRIAWDGPLTDADDIKKQLDILEQGGYSYNAVQIFMLYNHDLTPKEIEQKRIQCWKWGVQVMDCRFRPLDQFHENYCPTKKQDSSAYHIHSGWTDRSIKLTRQSFRRQNILVRYNKFPFHSKYFERKKLRDQLPLGTLDKLAIQDREKVRETMPDAWYPEELIFDNEVKKYDTIQSLLV